MTALFSDSLLECPSCRRIGENTPVTDTLRNRFRLIFVALGVSMLSQERVSEEVRLLGMARIIP